MDDLDQRKLDLDLKFKSLLDQLKPHTHLYESDKPELHMFHCTGSLDDREIAYWRLKQHVEFFLKIVPDTPKEKQVQLLNDLIVIEKRDLDNGFGFYDFIKWLKESQALRCNYKDYQLVSFAAQWHKETNGQSSFNDLKELIQTGSTFDNNKFRKLFEKLSLGTF